MSYSLEASGRKADVAEAIRTKIADYEPVGPAATETRYHLDAVAVAVDDLVEAVGTDDDELRVSIVGHANTDHRPAEGWANEQITIVIAAR